MNLAETAQVMDILSVAYPQFYKGQTQSDRVKTATLWASMFDEDDVAIVAAAVKALIVADAKGFPPHIGAVKARIRQITTPVEMTELEAWALVRRAIYKASPNKVMRCGVISEHTQAEESYYALPAQLLRLVGSPSQLLAWQMVPDDSMETVIQSNFMRSYRARMASDREYAALPGDIKTLISSVGIKQIEGGVAD